MFPNWPWGVLTGHTPNIVNFRAISNWVPDTVPQDPQVVFIDAKISLLLDPKRLLCKLYFRLCRRGEQAVMLSDRNDWYSSWGDEVFQLAPYHGPAALVTEIIVISSVIFKNILTPLWKQQREGKGRALHTWMEHCIFPWSSTKQGWGSGDQPD